MSAFVFNLDSSENQYQSSSELEDKACVSDMFQEENELIPWGYDKTRFSNSEIKKIADKISDKLMVIVKKQLES